MTLKLSLNPQAQLNGYISMMRNMFLTSSIAIGIFGFSNNFQEFKYFMRLISVSILVYSCIYGIKSAHDYKDFINFLEKHNTIEEPYIYQIPQFRQWVTMSYVYVGILSVIILTIIFRLF